MKFTPDDLRIQGITEVVPPEQLHAEFPATEDDLPAAGEGSRDYSCQLRNSSVGERSVRRALKGDSLSG